MGKEGGTGRLRTLLVDGATALQLDVTFPPVIQHSHIHRHTDRYTDREAGMGWLVLALMEKLQYLESTGCLLYKLNREVGLLQSAEQRLLVHTDKQV